MVTGNCIICHLTFLNFLFSLAIQVVQQWYFSQPHWQVESSRFRNFQHQIPLKLDIFSQDQSTMNVFNFNPEATDPSLFDVKPCFNWEEQRLVEFSLNGKHGSSVGLFNSWASELEILTTGDMKSGTFNAFMLPTHH